MANVRWRGNWKRTKIIFSSLL